MGTHNANDLLKSMLQQVGAMDPSDPVNATLESMAYGTGHDESLDVKVNTVESAYAKVGLEALDVLRSGGGIDSDSRFTLEAIVMPFHRPVVDIVNDEIVVEQLQEKWRELGRDERKAWNREKIRAIGRINVPGIVYAGTGFIVGPNLLMTNRHVAALFARGLGTRIAFQTDKTASFGFYHEISGGMADSVEVKKVVMIHPWWDMAVLEVTGLPNDRVPLVLDTTDPQTLTERKVVVIGYPGYTPSDDSEFMRTQERIFRGRYYVKRFQPGVFRSRVNVESYKRVVTAITHDCSTLGGNSGSAVIDVEKGTAVGLHFAGQYLEANYAVSPYDLASDPRVATLASAGVQFSGRVDPKGDYYGPIGKVWEAADSEQTGGAESHDAFGGMPAVQPGVTPGKTMKVMSPVSIQQAGTTITIPLEVSVSIGIPGVVSSQEVAATDRRSASQVEGQFRESKPAIDTGRFDLESLVMPTFGWKAALSLALASKLAYESEASVRSTCVGINRSWGFESCEFIDVDDTQAFVATSPDLVLISFRGTESRGDWLHNVNLPWRTRSYGVVHRGFLGAFQAVESRLRSALLSSEGKRVILTGHSLGGAIATVMAAEWQGFLAPAMVVTFGQPAVGKGAFRMFYQQYYAGKFFRFVNDDDIVPRVPPGYEHVGRLLHFDAEGKLQHGQVLPEGSVGAAESVRNVAIDEGLPMLTDAEYRSLQTSIPLSADKGSSRGIESLSVPVSEGIISGIRNHGIDGYIDKVAKFANG